MSEIMNLEDYNIFLIEIKKDIQSYQQKAVTAVNTQMIMLYYKIGQMIDIKQSQQGWGAKVTKRLSSDIKNELPQIKGFSERNIKRMLKFYREYKSLSTIMPQLVAQNNNSLTESITENIDFLIFQLPWGHNTILIERIKDKKIRQYYMQQILTNGWSRNILQIMIDNQLHKREGKLVSNFKNILPEHSSDLVQQSFKDPYLFDFLTMEEPFRERELELNLVKNMEQFLLELGSGFAFVGRQYKLTVGDDDFYIDLLFYHLKLRCYVVIELKKGKFKPEYSGQVNFYCSAVDGILANENDAPTIGLILCQEKNRVVAEYSLKNMTQPIGISEYELTEVLPSEFKSALPTIDMIEEEMENIILKKDTKK